MENSFASLSYTDWPARVQHAFDLYMLQDKPSYGALAAHPDVKFTESTLTKWAAAYHWQDERKRRLRVKADEARQAMDQSRLAALENLDKGLSNGAGSFALMASGICPMCAGRGKVKRKSNGVEIDCPKCPDQSGLFDVSKIPSKSLAIMFDRLEKVWGYTRVRNEDGEESSALTPQQQHELALEMMQKAGMGLLDVKTDVEP